MGGLLFLASKVNLSVWTLVQVEVQLHHSCVLTNQGHQWGSFLIMQVEEHVFILFLFPVFSCL